MFLLAWSVGRAAVIGRQAIRDRYARNFASDEIHVTVIEETISVRGSMASVTGRTKVTVTPRAGGEALRFGDWFVLTLRREAGSGSSLPWLGSRRLNDEDRP